MEVRNKEVLIIELSYEESLELCDFFQEILKDYDNCFLSELFDKMDRKLSED